MECKSVGVSHDDRYPVFAFRRIELKNRVYVMLDIYQLQNQYLSLRQRTRALRTSVTEAGAKTTEAEGYELQEKSASSAVPSSEVSEQQVALKREWRSWQLSSLKNVYVLSPCRLIHDLLPPPLSSRSRYLTTC